MNTSKRSKQCNAAEMAELVSRYRRSRLSKPEFVKKEGICLSTLRRYIIKTSGLISDGVGGDFVEIDRAEDSLNHGGVYKISNAAGIALEVPPGFCPREVSSLLDIVLRAKTR